MLLGTWNILSLYEPGSLLRWIFRKWDIEVMDWIEMAQDRDRWRGLVTVVMNFLIPYNVGNFLTR